MPQLFIDAVLLALITGICAAVYRGVLAYEPVLQWWFRFGNRFENRWFFAPIWGCAKCIAGQLALWSFLFMRILPAMQPHGGHISTVACRAGDLSATVPGLLLGLIFTICGAILTAMIFARIISKLENR